jgi:deoxyribodipyrimidine photo-lyase
MALRAADIAPLPHAGSLLAQPWEITARGGGPYQVFTPYWREWLATVRVAAPLAAPRVLPAPDRWPGSMALDELAIAPEAHWHGRFAAHWRPGEGPALAALGDFAARPLEHYAQGRDRTDADAVSRLSARLHHGELSPRQVWTSIGRAARAAGVEDSQWRASKFCSELVWREFAAHVLYHFPELPDRSFQPRYEQLRWRESPADLEAWQRGRTGIAMVDAGMRELWTTGWMHNRARMICASFLVKNLLIHWREGARWFWDTLVDADLANNTLNWQWVAGTGPDAAPWFRIFNPDTQADKFDPQGEYRRRWLGPTGHSGAAPIADLKASRQRALAAGQESSRKTV